MNVSGVGCRWGGINHGRLPGHARRNLGGRTHRETCGLAAIRCRLYKKGLEANVQAATHGTMSGFRVF
jgi:hypothetical protein